MTNQAPGNGRLYKHHAIATSTMARQQGSPTPTSGNLYLVGFNPFDLKGEERMDKFIKAFDPDYAIFVVGHKLKKDRINDRVRTRIQDEGLQKKIADNLTFEKRSLKKYKENNLTPFDVLSIRHPECSSMYYWHFKNLMKGARLRGGDDIAIEASFNRRSDHLYEMFAEKKADVKFIRLLNSMSKYNESFANSILDTFTWAGPECTGIVFCDSLFLWGQYQTSLYNQLQISKIRMQLCDLDA